MQSNTWFSSDHHFSHANIIKYCKRPFVDVAEMNYNLIKNINYRVSQDDTFYVLVDFAFGNQSKDILYQIICKNIHLILGNHDKQQSISYGWKSVQPYLEITLDKQFIVLCHYKFDVFNRSHHGAIQLYGHSHGSLPGNNQQLDVAVDCWDYKPVTLQEIQQRLKTLPPFRKVDYHGS